MVNLFWSGLITGCGCTTHSTTTPTQSLTFIEANGQAVKMDYLSGNAVFGVRVGF